MTSTRIETDAADPALLRRVVLGGAIGSFVEWYEFGVYGFLAAILAKVFFPGVGGGSGILATFAVFAVAFFAARSAVSCGATSVTGSGGVARWRSPCSPSRWRQR